MSLDRPTLSAQVDQAQGDINGRMPGADSRLRRSVLGVLARMSAGLMFGLYGWAMTLAREFLPDTALLWLPRHAAIWGLTPKAATRFRCTALATGDEGEEIEADTVVQRSDLLQFKVLADATLDGDGEALISLECLTAGATGITTAGSLLTFVSPVSAVDGTVTVQAGSMSGGADEESPEALRARLLTRIQNPPQGGSRKDYERWTLEVDAPTRVWVYPSWSGPSTVGVTFVCDGREDIIPTEDDLDAVRDHIDPLRPVTADVIVFAPIGDPLDLEIHLNPDTPEIRAAVTGQLTDLLAREGQPGGTILLTHIAEAVSLAAGEDDHDLVSPVANVTHAAGHMPILGDIDWGD